MLFLSPSITKHMNDKLLVLGLNSSNCLEDIFPSCCIQTFVHASQVTYHFQLMWSTNLIFQSESIERKVFLMNGEMLCSNKWGYMRAIYCKCINFHRREMQCNKVDEKQNQKSNFLLIANHKPLISKGGMERAQNSSKVWKNRLKISFPWQTSYKSTHQQ